MSQIQEGEQQEENSNDAWILPVLKSVLVVLGLAIFLSLVGVSLGANNFMNGPAHYPAWVLTTWFIVDILLLVLLLLHLVLLGIASIVEDNSGEATGGLIGMGLIILIGGGIALNGKHLAWISLFELLFLIAAVIIDVVFLMHMRES